MGAKIKAEAGLLLTRVRRPHRAPLLWIVLPFGSGLVVGQCSNLVAPFIPLDLGLAAALAALTTAAGRTRLAQRWWSGALILAFSCAGFAASREGSARRETRAQLSVAAGVQSVAVQILRLNPPQARGPSLRSVGGLGRVISDRPSAAAGPLIAFELLLRPAETLPAQAATVRLAGLVHPLSRRGGPQSYAGSLRAQGVTDQLSPAWLRGELAPPPWGLHAGPTVPPSIGP